MKSIDHIFRNGETNKRIDLSSNSWNKLESKLNQQKKKNSIFLYLNGIAASLLILGFMFISTYNTSEKYFLTNLEVDKSFEIYSAHYITYISNQFAHVQFTALEKGDLTKIRVKN